MEATGRSGDFETFKKGFDAEPLHRMLGITLVDQRPGFARICLEKGPETPSGIGGSVHGGVLAAMVDIVMLVAIFSDLQAHEQPAGTADLNISYLRPSLGERIYADATVVKRGRQLAMVEVEITNDEGQLCAKGRTLYAFRAGTE